jgi:uncharacterized protein (TIGR03067 family)
MPRFTVLVFALVVAALAGGCQKSDRQLAQGEWIIASVEAPGDRPDIDSDRLKDLLVVVKGDRITISHAKEKDRLSAIFTLDASKTPKELDVPEVFVSHDEREDVLPAPGRGIYKFEGDELVIALTIGLGKDLPRPTEFKPSASAEKLQTVLVFHLKRK